jgi:hypothetical protein
MASIYVGFLADTNKVQSENVIMKKGGPENPEPRADGVNRRRV